VGSGVESGTGVAAEVGIGVEALSDQLVEVGASGGNKCGLLRELRREAALLACGAIIASRTGAHSVSGGDKFQQRVAASLSCVGEWESSTACLHIRVDASSNQETISGGDSGSAASGSSSEDRDLGIGQRKSNVSCRVSSPSGVVCAASLLRNSRIAIPLSVHINSEESVVECAGGKGGNGEPSRGNVAQWAGKNFNFLLSPVPSSC